MTAEERLSLLGHTFVGQREGLRRAALAIVGSRERAEDVVQDAYLKVCDASKALDIRQPISYCFQVVRNLALDYWRRSAFESQLLAHEEEGQEVPAAQATPEQHAMSRQYLALCDKVLAELPERTRRVFEMYHLAEMTQRDIGTALGISLGLVNATLREATDALLRRRCLLEKESERFLLARKGAAPGRRAKSPAGGDRLRACPLSDGCGPGEEEQWVPVRVIRAESLATDGEPTRHGP